MAAFSGWEAALLRRIGAPLTERNLRSLRLWQRAEGGTAGYNPLNTTQRARGAGTYNSSGVRGYGSARQGLEATAETLLNGRYGSVVSDLRHNADPSRTLGDVGRSPWGTSGSLLAKLLGEPTRPSSMADGGTPAPSAASSSSIDPAVRSALAQQLIANIAGNSRGQKPDLMKTLELVQQFHSGGDSSRPEPGLSGRAETTTVLPGATQAKGVAHFDGKPVAAWIVPILKAARAHGWKGTVNSGYRSFADQTRIWNSGVRPAARPGTSNHEGSAFPRGAVDVTDAAQLASILHRLGITSLQWAGGKDPVHFSHPHGGHY